MAKVLLLGLDESIARKIQSVSSHAQHSTEIGSARTEFFTQLHADVVFLSGDRVGYLDAVRSICAYAQAPPVVVVTRSADTWKWLDAMDAGASDYCSAPFDSLPIKWVLDSAIALSRSRPKVMAAA
jgi:DNA-binding response OmpR family regulator